MSVSNRYCSYTGRSCAYDCDPREVCGRTAVDDTRRAEIAGVSQLVKAEAVDHPKHYNAHPSGIECIDVVEHMGFNLGNAMKYIWRCDEKRDAIEDLKKACWYIEREIQKREKSMSTVATDMDVAERQAAGAA
jgi:hypothetical protein